MNINDFSTESACNVPQKLCLKNPFKNGRELMRDEDGNTLDIFVFGIHADPVRNAMRERRRKWGDRTQLSVEDAELAGAEFLAAAVASWSSNIEDDDGPIECTRENAINLFRQHDWIAGQVRDFCFNLRNYDPKPSGASDTGRARSRGTTPAAKSRRKAGGSQQASA